MPRRVRLPVLLSYVTFVFVGINGGITSVLLPAQMGDYGVSRATIGLMFFAGSAGFALGGLSTGALIHRFGIRAALLVAGGTYVLAGLYLATRPGFVAFVLVQFIPGYACGLLESVLTVYLASLPDATTLINRLHAFWGVGALLGPVLATWIIGLYSWTTVWLVLALACVLLAVAFRLVYPSAASGPEPAVRGSEPPVQAEGNLLTAALRDRGIVLAAAMLTVYVGLEVTMGNWGFSYLVEARALPASLAGYSVSGYWLGLTLGRFLISPIAARIGASTGGMLYACLAGVTAAAALVWLSPTAALASAAMVLLGFFLGPVFPTTMATAPQLAPARLVPTAIGVINAASVVGGSALPWLAGAITQSAGMRLLLPFVLALALLQFAVWRPIAKRIRPLPRQSASAQPDP
jgi:fucose permease